MKKQQSIAPIATLLLFSLFSMAWVHTNMLRVQQEGTEQPRGDLFSGFPIHYLGEPSAENGFEITVQDVSMEGDTLQVGLQLNNTTEQEINLLLALKLYSIDNRLFPANNLDGTQILAPHSLMDLTIAFRLPAPTTAEEALGLYRLVYTPRGYSDVIFVYTLTSRPEVVSPPPSSREFLPADVYGSTGDPWKTLVLIYPNIDTNYVDLDGQTKHLTASMPAQDLANMQNVFLNLPHRNITYDYSDHTAEMEATLVVVDRPLTSLSQIGNGYWPSPDITRPELDQYGPKGKYDSVIIFWQASHPTSGQSIPDGGGWGWGYWPGETYANGMTYATVYNISWVWTTANQACHGEVFLHEWLHGVTGFYGSKGVPFNVDDLHGAEEAGYTWDIQDNGCWDSWLRDYMRGLVYENGERKALVPELSWYKGSITTWDITGWRGEYFNNETLSDIPVLVRNDPQINFFWELESPHPLVNNDHFSARWTKTASFNAGLYRFEATRDDGMRIWVDNVMILDKWFYGYTNETVDYFLTAGTHEIRVETFEIDGWASAIVNITPVTQSTSFTSAASQDGWILESTETGNAGGTMNTSTTSFNLGDERADRQYRSILSFNTGALPENAILTRVRLRIRSYGALVGNNNPFTWGQGLRVDVCKGTFGTSALQLTDFNINNAANCKLLAGRFGNTPVNGWYTVNLASTAFNRINLGGLTQFRLRFYKDDNDDGAADYWRFYSGNSTNASLRPTLIIEYYIP